MTDICQVPASIHSPGLWMLGIILAICVVLLGWAHMIGAHDRNIHR